MASIENREGKCSRMAGSAVPVNAQPARLRRRNNEYLKSDSKEYL